jgi:hypothetical protein
MSTKATLITSVGIAALLAVPSFLFGALDSLQFGIAAGYSGISAALVCMFAPQLAKL